MTLVSTARLQRGLLNSRWFDRLSAQWSFVCLGRAPSESCRELLGCLCLLVCPVELVSVVWLCDDEAAHHRNRICHLRHGLVKRCDSAVCLSVCLPGDLHHASPDVCHTHCPKNSYPVGYHFRFADRHRTCLRERQLHFLSHVSDLGSLHSPAAYTFCCRRGHPPPTSSSCCPVECCLGCQGPILEVQESVWVVDSRSYPTLSHIPFLNK